MEGRSYKTPEAFRMALEQRIRTAARRPAVSINRFRQLLVFDRFLARIFQHFAERAVVKGGLVLELRLDRVRTTKATLDAVYEVARAFLDPVLGGQDGTWDPDGWRWV